MINIRILTNEEYLSNLRQEIEQDGLRKAIEKRCDDILEECNGMRYITYMTVSEWLTEILDLVDESERRGRDFVMKRGKTR